MKNLKNNYLSAGLFLSLVIIGFLIGKFITFPFFEVSKTIDLVSLLSIVVTIWLAIIITTVFDKHKSNHRTEKDLVIKRVDNIYNISCILQKEASSGKIPYTEAASSIKRINTSIFSVYNLVEKCQFSLHLEIKNKLKDSIGNLRDTLTNSPMMTEEQIQKADIPIEVKDGIIHYNRQRINQIESNFDNLNDLLLELQIRINNK